MRLVIVLDCVDSDALAEFWASALGYHRDPFGPPDVRLTDSDKRWPDLLLQQIPEPLDFGALGRSFWQVRAHSEVDVPDLCGQGEGTKAISPARDVDLRFPRLLS